MVQDSCLSQIQCHYIEKQARTINQITCWCEQDQSCAEDKKLEYNHTKEDTVCNAYVNIPAVYAAGDEPQVIGTYDQEPRFPLPAGGSHSFKSRTVCRLPSIS